MEDVKNNSGQNLGIAALITAIITFVLSVIPCVGLIAIIPGIIAIILASVGLSQAARDKAPRGVLLAGLIIGIIASLISLSQVFVAGRLAQKVDKWPGDIQNIINDVQENVIRDLEDANISIKVESDGEILEINAGDNKEDLERKKKKNYQNIKITNELLEKTKHKKSISYNHILLLKSKIKSRENIILSIKDEVIILNKKIEVHQEVIWSLQKDLENLKEEYAKLVYYSFLNNDSYSNLMFIFAADDFNMGFRRLKYYQQYSKHRKKQARIIQETKVKINNELVTLDIIKADKKDLLLNEQIEKRTLFAEKSLQNTNLQKLNLKEGELKVKLKKQYHIAQNLQREIERIIEEEARLAASRSNSKSPDFFKLTPVERLISENI